MKTAVLFGGTGFIGTHLAQHMLANDLAEKIILVDLNPPRDEVYSQALQCGLKTGRVEYVRHDVRHPVPVGELPDGADVIFNLAAVHREPGHRDGEYFETNLAGAENVCAWASQIGCRTVVFTSSISPYGPSEEKRTESSEPAPETAYGKSKLEAEQIHERWQAAVAERRLLILRPGVIFGPGERGNVSRLVRSLAKGYFVYLGNRQTIKAAGYVKELCQVIFFGLDAMCKLGKGWSLINFTLDPPPTMERMVDTILDVLGKHRRRPNVPAFVLLLLTYPLTFVERIFSVTLPINAVRVRKLMRSNNVWPEELKAMGYTYRYTLESSLRDWMQDSPEDFSL